MADRSATPSEASPKKSTLTTFRATVNILQKNNANTLGSVDYHEQQGENLSLFFIKGGFTPLTK